MPHVQTAIMASRQDRPKFMEIDSRRHPTGLIKKTPMINIDSAVRLLYTDADLELDNLGCWRWPETIKEA
jgi:hypothetical protein